MKKLDFDTATEIQEKIKNIENDISRLKILQKNPKKISGIAFNDNIKKSYTYGYFDNRNSKPIFEFFHSKIPELIILLEKKIIDLKRIFSNL